MSVRDSLSYDPDKYPDCPDCETDVFVEQHPGKPSGCLICHLCGWKGEGWEEFK